MSTNSDCTVTSSESFAHDQCIHVQTIYPNSRRCRFWHHSRPIRDSLKMAGSSQSDSSTNVEVRVALKRSDCLHLHDYFSATLVEMYSHMVIICQSCARGWIFIAFPARTNLSCVL